MSSMHRTWQRAYQRAHGGKTHHSRGGSGGKYDHAPRAFKAERNRQEERFLRRLFKRMRENKGVALVPETKPTAE